MNSIIAELLSVSRRSFLYHLSLRRLMRKVIYLNLRYIKFNFSFTVIWDYGVWKKTIGTCRSQIAHGIKSITQVCQACTPILVALFASVAKILFDISVWFLKGLCLRRWMRKVIYLNLRYIKFNFSFTVIWDYGVWKKTIGTCRSQIAHGIKSITQVCQACTPILVALFASVAKILFDISVWFLKGLCLRIKRKRMTY